MKWPSCPTCACCRALTYSKTQSTTSRTTGGRSSQSLSRLRCWTISQRARLRISDLTGRTWNSTLTSKMKTRTGTGQSLPRSGSTTTPVRLMLGRKSQSKANPRSAGHRVRAGHNRRAPRRAKKVSRAMTRAAGNSPASCPREAHQATTDNDGRKGRWATVRCLQTD